MSYCCLQTIRDPAWPFSFLSVLNVKQYVGGNYCRKTLLIISYLPYANREDPLLLLMHYKGKLSSNTEAEAGLKITEQHYVAYIDDAHNHRFIGDDCRVRAQYVTSLLQNTTPSYSLYKTKGQKRH